MTDALRPQGWEGFVGQHQLKRRLDVHIEAALVENRRLPHILLTGPPGFGKTTIANLIAERMAEPFEQVDKPLSSSSLANLILEFEAGILLLDEIHRYPKGTQEDLLPVLWEGQIETAGGRFKVPLPELTIIGATTEPQGVIKPLRDRFPIRPTLEPYTDDEMHTIVAGMAKRAEVSLSDETLRALGQAAGGTPRNAGSLVLAARDLALSGTPPTTEDILRLCQTDADGLTLEHLEYLRTLDQLGGAKGVGLRQICAMVRLNEEVVRDLERILFQRNLVVPTSTGRALTPLGRARISDRPRRARVA